MKHIVSAMLLLLVSSAAFSYTIRIKNETDSAMIVKVEYGGAGVCSPDTWKLPAKGEISNSVGACCAKSGVMFSAQTGQYQGKTVSFDPPRTGFGLSCRSWDATATPVSPETFVVEQRFGGAPLAPPPPSTYPAQPGQQVAPLVPNYTAQPVKEVP